MVSKGADTKISPDLFVNIRQGNFDKEYELGKVLGTGAFSIVYQVTHVSTGMTRALKKIKKKSVVADESFFTEFNILRKMDHPHITKLLELFQDRDYYYLVTELCTGGELFDRITAKNHFNEFTAAEYVKQIISTVAYLHSQNICHRDLKPENLIFEKKDGDILKLIDFGMAAKFNTGDKLTKKTRNSILYRP